MEQPSSSLMFSTDLFVHLLSLPGVVRITFDQCEFGLRLLEDVVTNDVGHVVNGLEANDVKMKKPTTLITNLPGAEKLSHHRTRTHAHTHVIGTATPKGKSVKISKLGGILPASAMPWVFPSDPRRVSLD